jgi:hypothetical protein
MLTSCSAGNALKKPVYLTVVGVSIVVAAVSLGVTATTYLGLRAYSPKVAAQAAPPPAGDNVRGVPPEQWNNLFAPGDGMKLASRLPSADSKAGARATRTNFVLVGTIVSSVRSGNRAILWANGMKEPKAFREKEEVEPGAFLASVERDKAWITRGAEREKLEILPVGSRARPTGTPATAATTAPAAAVPTAYTVPSPAAFPGAPPRPGTASSPGLPPERALVVAPPPPPAPSSGDEDEGSSSRAERRRRVRENRR